MVRVVLGVSGGIAAYKAAEIVRGLVDAGASVRVVMTPAATKFIGPLTLAVLSKNPVVADLWDSGSGAVDHIELARQTDVLAVAPATADSLAKLARGIADDVLSTYALSHRGSLVVAPAMNTWMWTHPATLENVALLARRGAVVVPPDAGDLACGDVGAGRLAPPAIIVAAILEAGRRSKSLAGKRVVVSAGPTREPLDPVRFLSNRSSGRMGYALAREAALRGAEVVLVSGPVALEPPAGVRVVRVERTVEMQTAILAELQAADALIMAAAPADFQAEAPASRKLKRAAGVPELRLAPAPDILKSVREERKETTVVVAFAAETEELAENARRKLLDKGADLLVANDVSKPGIGFDADDNEVILYAPRATRDGIDEERLARASKAVIAGRILDRVASILAGKWPAPVLR